MLLAILTPAFAQEAPPIVNGSTTRDYGQVVTLYAADNDGYGYNFCSGTLIASDWVLTAAHCVAAMDDNERSGMPNLIIIVGYDLNTEAGVTDYAYARRWIEHPSYNDSTLQNDIGIIELETDITSIDIMPVNKDDIRSGDIGDDFRYVGWGITSDSGTDSSKKRTADIPLYDYDSMFLYGYDPEDNQNVCSGDSGGAALQILGTNAFELAAVNSFVSDDDSTYCEGGYTGGTRVDSFISWIEGYTPVYSYDELESDADTDTDTDTDTDSDTDTDTDTDTDADTDADSDTDTDADTDGGPVTDLGDDPVRPNDVGEDYSSESMLCATASPMSAAWMLALVGAAAARRRRS
ncbi:MAG: serine protease [Pseudomonadota bacterium]|nr:serine protease [Pseudomonadota bacterium]